jgi:hypothetical protein
MLKLTNTMDLLGHLEETLELEEEQEQELELKRLQEQLEETLLLVLVHYQFMKHMMDLLGQRDLT